MSILQFVRILWARRSIILVSTVACLLAGIIAAMLLPRTYSATSRVMLAVDKPDPLTGGNDSVTSTFARAYVPTEAELISDYAVARRTAENLGWTKDPNVRSQYEAYRAENASRSDQMDFNHWLASQISGNVSAAQYMATNVIDITYYASDPDTAAMMANAVRQAYADETTASKRGDAAAGAAWLERRLEQLRKESETAEQQLIAFQRANGVTLLDNNSDTSAARLQALANQAPNLGPTTVAGAPVNPNAAQIAALDARIASEAQMLGPNHPTIQDLRRQRAALAAVPVPGTSSTTSGPSLSAAVSAESQRVLAQKGKVEEAKRLQANVAALSAQYQQMATRAAQLRQQANATDFSIVMMDAAVAPDGPDSPKVILILIGSFAFGLGLGVLVSLIVEFMRRRVRGVEDLANSTNVPVIAIINPPPARLELK